MKDNLQLGNANKRSWTSSKRQSELCLQHPLLGGSMYCILRWLAFMQLQRKNDPTNIQLLKTCDLRHHKPQSTRIDSDCPVVTTITITTTTQNCKPEGKMKRKPTFGTAFNVPLNEIGKWCKVAHTLVVWKLWTNGRFAWVTNAAGFCESVRAFVRRHMGILQKLGDGFFQFVSVSINLFLYSAVCRQAGCWWRWFFGMWNTYFVSRSSCCVIAECYTTTFWIIHVVKSSTMFAYHVILGASMVKWTKKMLQYLKTIVSWWNA